MLTDVELARAAQQGDIISLGLLLERHRAPLHALALGILRHGPDAEDTVQETFLIALRGIERLHRPESVGPWLYGITRHVCLRRISRRRPQAALVDVTDVADALRVESLAEEHIDRMALRDWVWTALAELSEPLRVTILLRYFGAYPTYDEIASLLGVPVGTVRSRLNEARVRLADALLKTAVLAHDETRLDRNTRAAYFHAAFDQYNRGEGYSLFADAFAEDCVIAFPDRRLPRGRDWIVGEGEGDLEAGMKLHLTNVLSSKGVTIIEGIYENPPHAPFRCPPAISMVGFTVHDRFARMRMQFSPRPPIPDA